MAKKDMQVTSKVLSTVKSSKAVLLKTCVRFRSYDSWLRRRHRWAGEEKVIDVTFPEDYQAELVKQLNSKSLWSKLKNLRDWCWILENLRCYWRRRRLKADVRKNMEREVRNGLRLNKLHLMLLLLLTKLKFHGCSRNWPSTSANGSTVHFGGAGAQSFDKSMLPDELSKQSVQLSLVS